MTDEEIKLKILSQAIEEDMTENELFEIARERRYRINDLEKENKILSERILQQQKTVGDLTDRIEKMKCCGNCENMLDLAKYVHGKTVCTECVAEERSGKHKSKWVMKTTGDENNDKHKML